MSCVEISFQLKPTFSSRVSQPCMCDSYCASCGTGTGLQTQEGFPSDKCVFKTQISIVSIIFPCLVGYSCPGTYYRIQCNTMQYKTNTKQIQNKYKYNTNTIQFNTIQQSTMRYNTIHILSHILSYIMYVYIYIYPVPYPEVITAPADRLATSPQAKFWSFWGRMGLARQEPKKMDFDLLCGDNQQCLGFSSGHHGDFMGNPKKNDL